MIRLLIFTLPIILLLPSQSLAQRDLLQRLGQEIRSQGREVLRQQAGNMVPYLQQQQQQDRPRIQTQQMPSEGGSNSGGGRQDFGGGGDFRFQPEQNPWQGTQPEFPSQEYQTQPLYQQDPQRVVYRSAEPYTTSVSLPSTPVMSNQYAVIRCPDDVVGSIRYTLYSSRGNFSFTISAGQEQRFRVDTAWAIAYHNGTEQRRYAIRGGKTYTMKKTDAGVWQLYSVKSPGS